MSLTFELSLASRSSLLSATAGSSSLLRPPCYVSDSHGILFGDPEYWLSISRSARYPKGSIIRLILDFQTSAFRPFGIPSLSPSSISPLSDSIPSLFVNFSICDLRHRHHTSMNHTPSIHNSTTYFPQHCVLLIPERSQYEVTG